MKIQPKEILSRLYFFIESGYFTWGILLGGWSPVLVVFGYWIEEFFNYFINIIKLVMVKRRNPDGKSYLPFFMFAYLFFMFVHFVFIIILSGLASKTDPAAEELFEAVFFTIAGRGSYMSEAVARELFLIIIVVLITSLFHFYRSFLFNKKYKYLKPKQVINRSFGPVILPHLVIVFGIGGIILTGIHSAFSIVFIVVKLLIDITGLSERESPIADEV